MLPEKESAYEYFEGEDLARNKASGIYYAVKHFRGLPPLNKSTRESDKRKAKQKLPQLIKEHLEKYQDGKVNDAHSKTVAEVIDEIQAVETPGLRTGTQANRELYFRKIRDEMRLGSMPIGKVTLPVWIRRLDEVKAKGKRSTFFDYAKNMNVLERYAYEQRYISHLLTFPNPDKKKETGTVLTTDELRQLYEEMGETTRDQFTLCYECAMRLREALYLTWDRVDLETGEVTFRPEDVKTGSKTGKGRTIIISENALSRLRRRKEEQKQASRWVFPSPTGKGPVDQNTTAWEKAKEEVFKKNPAFQHWVRWHDLRHTAISKMLLELKMNIVLVSEYVGTSVTTLQRVYLHSRAEHTRNVTAGLRLTD
jgi:integrase